MMSAPEFTPRSESAWSQACRAALPPAARQILFEAQEAGGRQVDAADAWLAFIEQKTEAQARAKARREAVRGWGTSAAQGGDDAEADQIGPLSIPGMGEWARYQDPQAARVALEIRAAIEACDAIGALEAAGLNSLAQDQNAVFFLQAEMQRWAALGQLEEADTLAISRRDRVTLRMAQLALRAQREAIEHGQGVLL